MHNLACDYGALGRWKEGFELMEKVLPITKDKLGAEHPDTLKAMETMASAYADAGQPDQALPLQVETYRMTTKRFGREHPDTLTRMSGLAAIYWMLRKTRPVHSAVRGVAEPNKKSAR